MSSTKKGVGNMKTSEYVFIVVAFLLSFYCLGLSFARMLIDKPGQGTMRLMWFVLFVFISFTTSFCFYQYILVGAIPWLGDFVVAVVFIGTIIVLIAVILFRCYYNYLLQKFNKGPKKAGSPVIRSLMLNF